MFYCSIPDNILQVLPDEMKIPPVMFDEHRWDFVGSVQGCQAPWASVLGAEMVLMPQMK